MAAYVLDMLPNMEADLVRERMVPFVLALRASHPQTPVILFESLKYQNEAFDRGMRDRRNTSNKALRDAFKILKKRGDANIHLVPGEDDLGDDGEAGTDSVHPTDLGYRRMADYQEPFLRRIIKG